MFQPLVFGGVISGFGRGVFCSAFVGPICFFVLCDSTPYSQVIPCFGESSVFFGDVYHVFCRDSSRYTCSERIDGASRNSQVRWAKIPKGGGIDPFQVV